MRPQVLRASLRPFAALVSALLLVLSACRREPPPPSAEYEQATRQFRELYAQKLDEAYLDPKMGSIEAQLQRVPQDSLDAPSAQELLQRIQTNRKRMQDGVAARDKAVASAHEVVPNAPSTTLAPPPPPPPPEPVDAGPPDAGPVNGPQIGTPANELVAGFRGCFKRGAPINVEGRGIRESWEMTDGTACRLEFPGHADTVLLVEEGRVLMLLPKSSVRSVQRPQETGTVPPAGTDAGR
ncbi:MULTISPECIES: hypothetical protein [Myxococcus]|uniref:hypothetical protein n=1 Tax=Myxococcus TaxID=32 RepID=UPI0013D1A7AB|nr:hypothetical protein [Myxococcus eversor]NVJ26089.1 hypothetical protein [Myxococcus sp. AM011]